MKTIKFRVYDNLKKKMITEGVEWNIGMILEHKDDFELMQYTNLKDKNGKEIYEGDIVGDNEMIFGVIIFDEGCFKIDAFSKSQMPSSVNQDRANHWKIIGNKFENPELLENQK